MDRRALLTAALGAVVTACTPGRSARPSPPPTPSAVSPTVSVDPDVAILSAWWQSERRLRAALPAAATALRDAHHARAVAVAEQLVVRDAPLPTDPAPPTRPASQEEAAAYTRYVSALDSITSPDVAVLGAELAAGARQAATILALTAVRR